MPTARQGSIRLFRFFGIDVFLHWSWFLVAAGGDPVEVAVNSVTNQIYVANNSGNTVTVIDGVTNNTNTVNVDLNPAWLAVNQVTNQIYVANSGSNTVTVIDGATMNPTSVTVGNAPYELAVDPVTNKIYVANYADGTMTMIAGANAAPLQFVAVTPCRLYDTRP